MMINKSNHIKTRSLICMLLTTALLLTTMPLHGQHADQLISPQTPFFVSQDDAQNIASSFLAQHHKQNTYTLDTMEVLYDPTQTTILGYITNLHPIGYLIITSSKLLPPVVTYNWNSPFPTDINDPLRQFIGFDLLTQINNIDLFPNDIASNRIDQWNKFTDKQTQTLILYEQWPAEGTTETEGWIETTWHQDSPYNDLCPIDPDTGERSIAGCPAVAMAQIFNYYKTTNNVQFTDDDDYYHNYLDRYRIDDDYEKYDFPSFPELNTYLDTANDHFDQLQAQPLTDQDMAALNFAFGVACKQVYSPAGSGTFAVDQAYDAYMRFNCTTAELYTNESEELYEMIIDDIQHGRPVHLAVVTPAWDAGHNLIIDGYNTEGYFHLNFGWGGGQDNWYQLPLGLPYDLTVIEGVIVNIMNKETSDDLSCTGKIQLQEVAPGEEIQSSFALFNNGEPGSMLSWKILSVPNWGTWTITPKTGTDLTPEQGSITIDVTITAPNKKNKEYLGGIVVENMNNPGDREYIPVIIQTAKRAKTLSIELPNIFQTPCINWWILLQ